MSHFFEGLPLGYLLATSHNSTVNSVGDIVKNCQTWTFFQFKVNTVTLTEGQGHPRSYHFEGLPTGYLLANFHKSAVNSV